jgi:hypothetical protein
MERTDEILTGIVIDTDFAANTAVHLRQKTGGNLDELDPPEDRRCGKSCEISDNTASKGNDKAVPFNARLEQRSNESVIDVNRFRLFACRHFKQSTVNSHIIECVLQVLRVKARNIGVRNKKDPAAGPLFPDDGRKGFQAAGLDQNIIRSVPSGPHVDCNLVFHNKKSTGTPRESQGKEQLTLDYGPGRLTNHTLSFVGSEQQVSYFP